LAFAQTPVPLKFEAASVKVVDRNSLGRPGGGGRMMGGPGTSDPGRFTVPVATMLGLLFKAYGVDSGQVLGDAVQPRVGANFYSVTATMPPDTTEDQFQTMLQNLLIEWFHLKSHHETRIFPAYELVVDKWGTKLKEATHQADDGPAPSGPRVTVFHAGVGNITLKEQTIGDLARQLEMALDTAEKVQTQVMNSPRPRVVDKTGLTGKYTFTLEFSQLGPPGFTPEPGSPAADLPDLFATLREKLGLRLNKTQGVPVDVIVVDSVDNVPTEN
jgi:uncharacterized protein (TIGR03435 family)